MKLQLSSTLSHKGILASKQQSHFKTNNFKIIKTEKMFAAKAPENQQRIIQNYHASKRYK